MDGGTQKILELLRTIRKRPRMFLWNAAEPYKALVDFVSGYLAALSADQSRSAAVDLLSACGGGFANWLFREKAATGFVGDRNVGWPGLISLSYPNEQERFDAFFTLLEEYVTSVM